MAVTFTPEQQRAIDLHGCNILVSAAAGSGKTAVLAERIIRRVCDEENPVDIDRLLVVTFTNAAAAEMRERIASGVSKKLAEHPESAHMQKQAALLHNAQITTIDSFCLFLLRNHFNEIGLDPAFRIADEGEIKLMQQEVLKELLEDSYASGSEAFRYCVEYFCSGGKESVLEQHILTLSRYAASFPWPERWLEERKTDYDAETVEELCASAYAAFLTGYLQSMAEGCAEKLSRVKALCEAPDGPYMYGELVDGELEQLQGLSQCSSLEEYGVKLSGIAFGRLSSKKDDSVSAVKRELAKNLRAQVKEIVQKLEERFFATPLELAVRQGKACGEPVGTLIDLVLDFQRRMQEKKQEKRVIDFSDMEHYALNILLKDGGEGNGPADGNVVFGEGESGISDGSVVLEEGGSKPAEGSARLGEEGSRAAEGGVGIGGEEIKPSDGDVVFREGGNRPSDGDVVFREGGNRPADGGVVFREEGNRISDGSVVFEGEGSRTSGGSVVFEEEGSETSDVYVRFENEGIEAGGKEKPSPVALEYQDYFDEILIDEYQDSNLVQEYLLRAVSGEAQGRFNRFMVGDVKQSIYKFRLARPELFLEKYETYEEGQGCCQRIDLSKNFRSRTSVVEAVNDVFARLMSREAGGICYDERAALYAGAAYPENEGCESELLLISKPDKEEDTGDKEAEALAIARKIKELRGNFLVTEKGSGTLRAARYSDMVILLRTNSGWDEEFKAVLEKEGIPVYITSKTGYFAALEVQELLQLLRVLDNPCQDIPLFGVMKSLFGGFSEEEIALIRSQAKGCCLYEALKAFAVNGMEAEGGREAENGREADTSMEAEGGREADTSMEAEGGREAENGREADISRETEGGREADSSGGREADTSREAEADRETDGEESFPEGQEDLRRKAAAFLKMISAYRSCTVYLPIRELLTKLVEDFGYLDYVTALPAGSRRRGNVEMLFTKASDFEKTSYFGLFHFIRYMEQLEKYDVDYGEAELLDENADVVRIMSIHKSKGLEFPITFVSGLSKRFNMQDVNQALILDMDLGLAVDYVDPERRIRNKTLRRMALSGKLRQDSLAEELRVLYVAMTRAREKLILTGVLEKAQERWEQACQMYETGGGRLTYLDFMEAGSYLDFLLPVLPDTSVRVSVVEREERAAGEITEQMQLLRRREILEQAGQSGPLWMNEREADGEQAGQAEEVRKAGADGEQAGQAEEVRKAGADGEQAGQAEEVRKAGAGAEEQEASAGRVEAAAGQEAVSRQDAFLRLTKRLNAVYPYAGLAGLYTKTTVSELKIAAMADKDEEAFHTFEEREVQPYIPMFRREEEKVSGTVRGNAYHRVMELLDFEALMKQPPESLAEGVHRFLCGEVESRRLSEAYLQAVRERRIVKFLRSELAQRMWKAQREDALYREQPFVLGIDARRLTEDFPEEETVLIQGIIDAFFAEEDGLVLLDYKTDSVASMRELWNRYETQMDYYQEAVEKLMGMPVKERILYSFHLEDYGSL